VGFLNFEIGLLQKILVYTLQPRIGALRCRQCFLSHFNISFPQAVSWRTQTLPPETSAILIGALSLKPQPWADLLNKVPMQPPCGSSGRPSVPTWASMPTAYPPRTPSLFSRCMPTATAQAPSPPVVDPSGLARWRMPFERWARRTPGWGPLTLA
jgi:hypothetical protein